MNWRDGFQLVQDGFLEIVMVKNLKAYEYCWVLIVESSCVHKIVRSICLKFMLEFSFVWKYDVESGSSSNFHMFASEYFMEINI